MRQERMASDPIITWLIENLKKPGKSQSGLARHLKVHPSAINRVVNGTRGLKSNEIAGAADYFGESAPMAEVRTSSAPIGPVAVAGRVAAGVFVEVDDMDQSETEWISEPVDQAYPNARRMAFDVDGDSMNDLKPRPILPGDRLICVAYEDIAHMVPVRDGMVVVVERTRDGGQTREWSVKQIEFYEDRIEFHPRSTNPKHKPIVVKRDYEADEGTQVQIIGLLRRVSNEFPAY